MAGARRGDEAEERIVVGADDGDDADRFMNGEGQAADRRRMDAAFELVGPGAIGEEAVDGRFDFASGIGVRYAALIDNAAGELAGADGEILGEIIEHLGAGMLRGGRPAFRLAGGLDGVAYVLAVAVARLADQVTGGISDFHRIAAVGARLLAADIELGRPIDRRRCRRALRRFYLARDGLLLPGLGLQILESTLAAAFAAEARFAVAAKANRGIEEIGGIDPDDAAFELRRHIEGKADGLTPQACRQAIARIVGELDGFIGRAESVSDEHGTEDFLARHRR